MNPRELIQCLYRHGITIELAPDGAIAADGPDDLLTPDVVAGLRAQRAELIDALQVMRDEYEERAAIIEYVSNWPRDAAERAARREVYEGRP